MSLIWGSKAVLGMAPATEIGPKWRETANRAVELDPNLAEGQQALAQGYTWFEFDWDRAEKAYRRAIELDPGFADAYHLLAFVYGDLGDDERATRTATQAAKLNPSYAKAETGLSLDSYSTARYEELIGERGSAQPAVAAGGAGAGVGVTDHRPLDRPDPGPERTDHL